MNIEEIRSIYDRRIRVADYDPEAGHGIIDDICESAIHMAVRKTEGWEEAMLLAENILFIEKQNDWVRWYA